MKAKKKRKNLFELAKKNFGRERRGVRKLSVYIHIHFYKYTYTNTRM